MKPAFAYVEFLDDCKKVIVPIIDIKEFCPQVLSDFSKTKIYLTKWPQQDDLLNLELHERRYYKSTILSLSVSKDGFPLQKRISKVPHKLFHPPTDSESDIADDLTITQQSSSMLPGNLLSIRDRRVKQIQKELDRPISKDSEHSPPITKGIDAAITQQSSSILPGSQLSSKDRMVKQMHKELDRPISKDSEHSPRITKEIDADNTTNQCFGSSDDEDDWHRMYMQSRKRFKLERQDKEELQSQFMAKTEELEVMREELKQMTARNVELQDKLMPFIQKLAKHQEERESDALCTPSDKNMKTTLLDGISVSTVNLTAVECQQRNSIYVKELAVLMWTKEELLQRSVTGKTFPKNATGESPLRRLTPEKLLALKNQYRKRLQNSGYDVIAVNTELRNVNRLLAEKISDLKKTSNRRRLNFNLLNASYTEKSLQNASCSEKTPPRTGEREGSE